MNAGKLSFTAVFLAFLFLILCVCEISFGTTELGLSKILGSVFGSENLSSAEKTVILQIRLPRLVAGILAGGSLALAGAGMQSLFRNPLADPSITGVSAGAAMGAVLAISFFPLSHSYALQIGALAFGIGAAVLVAKTAKFSGGKISPLGILLAGIAVNAFCAAVVGICIYGVRDAGLRGFVFWSLGSLEAADWKSLSVCFAICAPAWLVMIRQARALNLMLLGSRQAFDAGVNVEKIWILSALCAAAMTAACVAVCGNIAFVGIIVPHTIRLLLGPDNRALLPLSALAGACTLIFADLVSRSISPTDPVPIGAITALIGAPFFAAMLGKAKNYD